MSNLMLIPIGIFGVISFLFFFWKRLKEDYSSTVIFYSAFYILTGMTLGFLIFNFGLKSLLKETIIFNPNGLWFWGIVVGLISALAVSILKFNVKVFETFEAVAIGLLFWFDLIFLFDSVNNSSIFSLIGFVVVLLLIILFFFLDRKYRKFTWYKSGKVGFSGLTVLSVLFLLRIPVALVFPFVLSFVGKIDALISGSIAFLLFYLLYNLGEQ